MLWMGVRVKLEMASLSLTYDLSGLIHR
jgi:hypothetical protein